MEPRAMTASTIGACPRCGQVLQLPDFVTEQHWRCPRCHGGAATAALPLHWRGYQCH
ncbi:MAG: hypothetical protein H0W72_02450 [Planctomycetes bacterium]|nr:hypothetical protein [Planctomycetota bacterium]